MKILISPDKFKDSLSAQQACNAIEKGIKKFNNDIATTKIPLADGGEGSLFILQKKLNFEKIYCEVHDPLFRQIKTWYGIKNNTAYIELANASGLQLLTISERNAGKTSSLGTGELILDAIKRGITEIFLFIGGSATNDAATGIANALGYKFIDDNQKELKPIGENLNKIKSIKYSANADIQKVNFYVMTDVRNPFCGDNGAAKVYAKQKGANEKVINNLDEGLKNISEIFKHTFKCDITKISGSGAAGGIGGGMKAFFNASILSGTESILEILQIERILKDCDYIITGEGKFDEQSLNGKVVGGIINMAKKYNKNLGVICGKTDFSRDKISKFGFDLVQLESDGRSKKESINNAEFLLVEKTRELMTHISTI